MENATSFLSLMMTKRTGRTKMAVTYQQQAALARANIRGFMMRNPFTSTIIAFITGGVIGALVL